MSNDKNKILKIKLVDLENLLQRKYSEGRGMAKVQILKILQESRLEPKEKVTITYLQEKIQSEV